jgi:hypothetical protein
MKVLRNKLALHILITLSIVVVFLILTAIMGFQISNRVLRIEGLKNEIALSSKSIELLVVLSQQSQQAQQYQNTLASSILTHDQLISFPKDIQLIGSSNGLNVSVRFGVESGTAADGVGTIKFRGSAEGTMEDFIRFLGALRRSRYIVDFTSFSLDGGAGSFSFNFDGSVFFLGV